jgi:hypothetical protein
MTGILDLPAELVLDIFVMSSATTPKGVDRHGVKRCGKSTDMYNLARSCKQLYAIFKQNEYPIFYRIISAVIPRDGISSNWALKLLYTSWSRRGRWPSIILCADVRGVLRPTMYGRFLRVARHRRIHDTFRYFQTKAPEDLNETDAARQLFRMNDLWRHHRQARNAINRVWNYFEVEVWSRQPASSSPIVFYVNQSPILNI